MMLVESGRLLLQAPVQSYVPEFQGKGKDKVLVEDLLMHTSGLPATLPLERQSDNDRFMQRLYEVPLASEPRKRSAHSNLGLILLGEIVARASGEPLDRFLAARLFGPLGMHSTAYRPLQNPGPAGPAGLFSSARDLATFAQLTLNRGMYDYTRYFSPAILSRFSSSAGPKAAHRAYAWIKPSASDWTGRAFSASAFGYAVPGGSCMWVDPEKQLFIIFMTHSTRAARDHARADEARREILESILRALR
jgi:CubicO group peptidase (beta-lactamase class C family)